MRPDPQRCPLCGALLLEGRYRPLVRFDEGVYAVDSVMRRECPTEDCPSDGHIEWYWKIGGLMDLTKRDTERPLYAKQDRETGRWERVPKPEEHDEGPGTGGDPEAV